MDAVAKGVRRTKSHLSGRLEFGNECALTMHRGRSLDVIVSAEIKQSPWTKLVEPDRFAVASLVAELIDAFCEPDLPLPDVYELLTGMLGAIASADRPQALLPRFSLRLLSALGIEPPATRCVRCGGIFSGDHAFVDADSGGFICERCRERWRDVVELDAEDLKNLRALAAPRGDAQAVLYARPRIASAIEAIVSHHLGRRPKAGVAALEFVTPEA